MRVCLSSGLCFEALCRHERYEVLGVSKSIVVFTSLTKASFLMRIIYVYVCVCCYCEGMSCILHLKPKNVGNELCEWKLLSKWVIYRCRILSANYFVDISEFRILIMIELVLDFLWLNKFESFERKSKLAVRLYLFI